MDLGPRIYGSRLVAGIVIWVFSGLLAVGAAVTTLGSLTSGGHIDPPILLGSVAVVVACLAIAAGFWRGNRLARWLAIFPAGGLFLAAFVWWALSGMCASGAPMPSTDVLPVDALSCPTPLPPRSLMSWVVTAVLAGSGALVLLGMFRPGVKPAA